MEANGVPASTGKVMAQQVFVAAIDVVLTVQNGFLGATENSCHCGLIDGRHAGHGLGHPEKLDAFQRGIDQACLRQTALDKVFDLVFAHAL